MVCGFVEWFVASMGCWVFFVCCCVQGGAVSVEAARRMYFVCVILFSWMCVLGCL